MTGKRLPILGPDGKIPARLLPEGLGSGGVGPRGEQGTPVNVSIGMVDGLVRVWGAGSQANLYLSTSWILPKPKTL